MCRSSPRSISYRRFTNEPISKDPMVSAMDVDFYDVVK
jgi:hypothetical protein